MGSATHTGSVVIVTGSSGLIGSESVRFFHEKGFDVHGIDNNMREYFFGPDASVEWNTARLTHSLNRFRHCPIDIRNGAEISRLFLDLGANIACVIHAAGQPSHDWAAREPFTDFTINANGTLNLLEATRRFCPDAVFVNMSSNKVYGDTPNSLPLVEMPTRWDIESSHVYSEHGIDESMSIDQCQHSLMGASKLAADVLVQEYGKYFGLKTTTFRGGCLTGPSHSGAELHGFLAYLVKCALTGRAYTIFGYKGKQVRDNIHSADLVSAFWHVFQNPRSGEVYNIGGSRHSNCSILEAIRMTEELCGRPLQYSISDEARRGDHVWWVSDVRRFQTHYPGWRYRYDQKAMLTEMIEAGLGVN